MSSCYKGSIEELEEQNEEILDNEETDVSEESYNFIERAFGLSEESLNKINKDLIYSTEESNTLYTNDNIGGISRTIVNAFTILGLILTFLSSTNVFVALFLFIFYIWISKYYVFGIKNIRFFTSTIFREKYYKQFKLLENTPEGKIISKSLKELSDEYDQLEKDIKSISSAKVNIFNGDKNNKLNLIKAYLHEAKVLSKINKYPPVLKEIFQFFHADYNKKDGTLNERSSTFSMIWKFEFMPKSQEELDELYDTIYEKLNDIAENHGRNRLLIEGGNFLGNIDSMNNRRNFEKKIAIFKPRFNNNPLNKQSDSIFLTFIVRLSREESEAYKKLSLFKA